jgi:hypothetical protein
MLILVILQTVAVLTTTTKLTKDCTVVSHGPRRPKKKKGNHLKDDEDDDKSIQDIVCMVLDNINKRKNNDDYLQHLSHMIRKNIDVRRNNNNNNFNINDEDIREIVCMVRANKNVDLPRNVFTVRQIGIRNCFNYNEYLYEINIGRDNTRTLPEFLNNLRQVFSYLINIMKYNASFGK